MTRLRKGDIIRINTSFVKVRKQDRGLDMLGSTGHRYAIYRAHPFREYVGKPRTLLNSRLLVLSVTDNEFTQYVKVALLDDVYPLYKKGKWFTLDKKWLAQPDHVSVESRMIDIRSWEVENLIQEFGYENAYVQTTPAPMAPPYPFPLEGGSWVNPIVQAMPQANLEMVYKYIPTASITQRTFMRQYLLNTLGCPECGAPLLYQSDIWSWKKESQLVPINKLVEAVRTLAQQAVTDSAPTYSRKNTQYPRGFTRMVAKEMKALKRETDAYKQHKIISVLVHRLACEDCGSLFSAFPSLLPKRHRIDTKIVWHTTSFACIKEFPNDLIL